MSDSDSDDAALPDWVGSFSSGRGDLAERHEEITRDEPDDHTPPHEESGAPGA